MEIILKDGHSEAELTRQGLEILAEAIAEDILKNGLKKEILLERSKNKSTTGNQDL